MITFSPADVSTKHASSRRKARVLKANSDEKSKCFIKKSILMSARPWTSSDEMQMWDAQTRPRIISGIVFDIKSISDIYKCCTRPYPPLLVQWIRSAHKKRDSETRRKSSFFFILGQNFAPNPFRYFCFRGEHHYHAFRFTDSFLNSNLPIWCTRYKMVICPDIHSPITKIIT